MAKNENLFLGSTEIYNRRLTAKVDQKLMEFIFKIRLRQWQVIIDE